MSQLIQDPKRLRRLRIEAGLNQTDLARRAQCSKQLVCMVERGSANFSPRNLKRIAEALECDIKDLMPDDEDSLASSRSPS